MIKPSNLFIIGAPKAGTSAVAAYLGQHPKVFLPQKKEPRFYDAKVYYDDKKDYPVKSFDEYLEFYKSNEAQLAKFRIDGSVFVMYEAENITKILEHSPEAKFIIILRDPLEATKSMFTQRLKQLDPLTRELSEDFCSCWELSKERKRNRNFPEKCKNKFLFRYDLLYSYELYLPKIIKLTDDKNLLICSYKQLRGNKGLFYKKIMDFLELENIDLNSQNVNPSFVKKNSLRHRVADMIIKKISHFGKKIRFSSNSKTIIKKILYGSKSFNIKVSSSCDADIKKSFESTYKYLNEINIKT